jgi:hypothetical protein
MADLTMVVMAVLYVVPVVPAPMMYSSPMYGSPMCMAVYLVDMVVNLMGIPVDLLQ